MFNHYYRVITGALLMGLTGLVQAVEVKQEFSAEAVQMAPQRPTMVAKMYVSKKAVRTESNVNNQQLVEIVFPEEGRRVMLLPQQRSYIEQRGMPDASPAAAQLKDFNPCAGVQGSTCKKLATEKLQGRQTEKWQITSQREGRPVVSLHWIDTKRKMPLRESFADGTKTELEILKKEKINGRNTEKWQLTVTRGDGQSMQSLQWYDTQLQMVIREELPGGYVRELRNIKLARQAKKLFSIPEGYRRQAVPSAPPAVPASMPVSR